MRFHCNSCRQDFTTLSQDKEKKIVFSMFIVDKMVCPNCGASNKTRTLKPLRKTRSRWQPKRRSMDMDEYDIPNIILHTDCQSRLCGSISTGKIMVVCDGCPSAFNCLTGNVDDGAIVSEDKFAKRQGGMWKVAPLKEIEQAKEKVAEIQRKDKEKQIIKLAETLRGKGFSFSVPIDNLGWSAKYCGTIWKLDNEDIKAILENSWHTPKTSVMKNTFVKHDISLEMVQELLSHVYPLDKEQGM